MLFEFQEYLYFLVFYYLDHDFFVFLFLPFSHMHGIFTTVTLVLTNV